MRIVEEEDYVLPRSSRTLAQSRLGWARISVDSVDRRFAHSILVPERCRFMHQVPEALADRGDFTILSHFSTGGPDGLAVTVSTSLLSREVDPGTWLAIQFDRCPLIRILRRGASILSRPGTEFLTASPVHEGNVIARHLTFKDGPRLFWVEARCAEYCYLAYSQAMADILNSLELSHAECLSDAEEMRSFLLERPFSLRFELPASWQVLRSQVTPNHARLVAIQDQSGNIVGRIGVSISPTQAGMDQEPVARLSAQLQYLGSLGFDIIDQGMEPFLDKSNWRSSWIARPSISDSGRQLDATCLLLNSDRYLVELDLISPPYSSNSRLWAINNRAFEILTNTLFT